MGPLLTLPAAGLYGESYACLMRAAVLLHACRHIMHARIDPYLQLLLCVCVVSNWRAAVCTHACMHALQSMSAACSALAADMRMMSCVSKWGRTGCRCSAGAMKASGPPGSISANSLERPPVLAKRSCCRHMYGTAQPEDSHSCRHW